MLDAPDRGARRTGRAPQRLASRRVDVGHDPRTGRRSRSRYALGERRCAFRRRPRCERSRARRPAGAPGRSRRSRRRSRTSGSPAPRRRRRPRRRRSGIASARPSSASAVGASARDDRPHRVERLDGDHAAVRVATSTRVSLPVPAARSSTAARVGDGEEVEHVVRIPGLPAFVLLGHAVEALSPPDALVHGLSMHDRKGWGAGVALWGIVDYSGAKWRSRKAPPDAPRRVRAHTRRQEPPHPAGQVPGRPSATGSSSRAGSTAASTPSRAATGSSSSTRSSARWTRSAARAVVMARHFFSAAIEAELDKQGRVMIPAALGESAKLGREVVVAGVYDHLEIWDRATWREQLQRGRRERGACCRTSCSQTRLITSRFSPRRCARRSPCARARRSSTRRSVPAATRELLAADLQGDGKLIAIDRDPTVAPYFERFRSTAGGIQTRLLRGELRDRAAAARLERGGGGRDPARPRRLEHAARPARARLLVRGRRAARHAHGSRPPRSRRASSSTSSTSASSQTIFHRYGEERYAQADRPRDRAPAARAQPFERTGDLVDTIRAAIPAPARFGEGHPAKRVFQALRIAVNDELRLARGGAAGGARDAAARRPPRGDQLPLARGPHRQDVPARRRARLHLPAGLPRVRLRERAGAAGAPRRPVRPSADEIAANPRAASARLRAAVKA